MSTVVLAGISIAFSAPIPNGALQTLGARSNLGVDVVDGGAHRVMGTVKNTGTPNTPVQRRVRLHEQLSGRVVRERWSDPVTGAFSFDGVAPGIYYVTTFDHTGQYNGVIAANLQSEPMP